MKGRHGGQGTESKHGKDKGDGKGNREITGKYPCGVCGEMEIEGRGGGGKGRPKKTRNECLNRDVRALKLKCESVKDRVICMEATYSW